jgi:epoxyqueuosine reductase
LKKEALSQTIRQVSTTEGIDVVGFANASEFPDYPLKDSLRCDPKRSMPRARSIIVAGIYIGGLALPVWQNHMYGRTSRLFLSGFFLDVVKPMEPIARVLEQAGYQALICDGSSEQGSILPLKLAAVRAGLGWQGKHSLLISKQYGTYLALGGIITDADLEHNTREETNRCHTCDICQQACPLSALDLSYVLNKDVCMSNRLQNPSLPEKVQTVMENRIVDCEICQDACPWNSKHLKNPLITTMGRALQQTFDHWESFFYLPDLARLSESGYGNTLGRLGTDIPYDIFYRNVLIAMQKANIQQQAHDE